MANNENIRVLVTGGAGFIGRHLIRKLLDERYQVRSLDIKKPDIDHTNLQAMEGSFTDQDCVQSALNGVDIVYHLASTTIPSSSNNDPLFDINTNLTGSVDLINQSIEQRVKKFIFVSSGGTVYGVPSYLPVDEKHPTNPLCSYGIIKLAIEKYLLMYRDLSRLDCAIIRLSNPYGEGQNVRSGQGVIGAFCNKAIRGESLEIWGDGNVVRDYIHVSDAASALLSAIDYDLNGNPIINIGYGKGYSLNHVMNVIEKSLGKPVGRRYHSGRNFDIPEIYLDTGLAKQQLNWSPLVSLESGVLDLLEFLVKGLERDD